ncbi:histidine phosphatase family protein [Anaerobranca gottschalkii]|uniref:2,3-bisphosphoglycerate-dependent phosphoglycerate mutase n=1 Tax=Anaerobranca gottschalkii DSM 13577 TaxID=1120990 RepID=A0A1I0AUD4_9FIRM|nr:histidine phosphatase family protein [Anaerobranca gottschalkii]SES97990.1 2,3-bisphosphoglycerate-dependent phosphoglycerate mutase [Anaerobranca gottschalkii DSM 13577]
MIRLILVRHGQSVADIEGKHEGRADFPLTELGVKQSEKLANYFSVYYGIDQIYCSPLMRAKQTAMIIGKKFMIEPEEVEELMEMDNGLLAGLTFKEAEEKFPITDQWKKIYYPLPGGESVIDFRMRIEKFWHKFKDKYLTYGQQKTICIVAHGGTISMLYKGILGLPIDTKFKVPTFDTGFHIFEITEEGIVLIKANCLEHLLMEKI